MSNSVRRTHDVPVSEAHVRSDAQEIHSCPDRQADSGSSCSWDVSGWLTTSCATPGLRFIVDRVREAADLERLAGTDLVVVCLRFCPPSLRGNEQVKGHASAAPIFPAALCHQAVRSP